MIKHSSVLSFLPAYPVDLADGQWREFRASLPLLSLAVGGSFIISQLYNLYTNANKRTTQGGNCSSINSSGSMYGVGRVHIDLVYGLCLLFLQHGLHSFIVLGLLLLSYIVGILTRGSRYRIGAAWAVGIFTILLKESYRVKRNFPVRIIACIEYDRRTYPVIVC